MTALVGMRLTAFVRSGRALAPIILGLVVLGVIYGGGASQAAPAFAYAAVMLFPVLAWQTKLVLDAEPDVQRRLARLTIGPRREAAAGVLTAAILALAVCLVSMLAPWPFNAICGPGSPSCGPPGAEQPPLLTGIALGVLAHLLAAAAALGLGALSSRVVTRTVRNGLTVLVVGAVLAIVLGLKGSIAPWLAPPVMATARALTAGAVPSGATLWGLTAWAAVWSTVALAGYALLRRRRA
jgi:hypothetical protein